MSSFPLRNSFTSKYKISIYYKTLPEHVLVTGGSAINQPRNSFQSYPHVYHLDGQFLPGSVRKSLILHEHHVPQLEPVNKILNRWP